MLRAVLFDLWETLINDKPERAQPRRLWRSNAVLDVLRAHGHESPLDAVQAALDASSGAMARLHDQGQDLTPGGRARLFMSELEAVTNAAAPESSVDALEAVITSMPLEVAPLVASFAVETLASVKQRGLATGLVCNAGFTTAPHLVTMLAHYGLKPHLDVLVFSDQEGFAKPDPRIFTKALKALGMTVDECAFVGDNPHTDIAGAQAVGLYAVQVGNKQRDGVTPDARIDDLSELPAVLDRLR
jgi:putative hydrolase of the HAD superfamily